MDKSENGGIELLLQPKSVAVIGASRNPSKIGAIILRNIIFNGFSGKIYPINPYAKELYNYNCYPNLKSVNGDIDFIIICTPFDTIEEKVQESIDVHAKAVMIVGTGYAESGKIGVKLQQTVAALCQEAGVALLGPNTSGIVSTQSALNASMIPTLPEKGNSSLITQSGSIASELFDYAQKYDLGLQEIINIGNKAALDETTFLEYYNKGVGGKKLHAIGLALENISDGTRFMKTAKEISKDTAVVTMITGESKSAKEQIRQHTGVIRQDNHQLNLALKQSGCIVVDTQLEVFDLLLGLSWQPVMKGNGVSVVTNTGGGAVIAADQIEKHGLSMFNLTDDLRKFINQQLGRATQFDQVIGLEGKSLVDRIGAVVDVVLAESEVHAVLVILSAHNIADLNEIAGILGLLSRMHKKTMLVAFMGGEHIQEGIKILAKQFIPSFENIDSAVKVMGRMYQYYLIKSKYEDLKISESSNYLERFSETEINQINDIITTAYQVEKNKKLNYESAKKVLYKAGFNIPASESFSTIEQLYEAAESLGFPVILKCPNGRRDVICNNEEDLKRQFKEHLNCGRNYSELIDSTVDMVKNHSIVKDYSNENIFEIKLRKDDYSFYVKEGIDKIILDKLSFGYYLKVTFMSFGKRNQFDAIATENKEDILNLIDKTTFIKYSGIKEEGWVKLNEKFIWSIQNAVRIVNTFKQVNELKLKCIFDNNSVVIIDYSCSIEEPRA